MLFSLTLAKDEMCSIQIINKKVQCYHFELKNGINGFRPKNNNGH